MSSLKWIVVLFSALALISCGGGDPESSPVQSSNGVQQRESRMSILSAGTNTASLAQTATGFFYPTGTASYSIGAWWLAKDPNYFPGEYHLGLDIMRDYGQNVYAIADGTVKRKSPGGWGDDNCALAIEHKTGSGEVFVAIYGHLLCTSVVSEKQSVTAGQPIGTIGDWPPAGSAGDHLHFGIHPGPFSTIAASQWGRQFITGHWTDPCTGGCLNTMTDPIVYIETHTAYNESVEVQTYCQGNVCWKPGNGSCESATTRYRMLNPPFVQVVGAEVCGELQSTLVHITANPNPQQRVPEEHGWQTWFRKALQFFGLGPTASAAELQQLNNFRTLNTVYVLEGRIVSGSASKLVHGTGQGYQVAITEMPAPDPPDYVTKSVKLFTPWGTEVYKYGLAESIKIRADFKNIGDGDAPGNVNIKVHFYRSRGYKEDSHSDWVRVGEEIIQSDNLRAGQEKTEFETVIIAQEVPGPGIWNFVVCIDHPQNENNNGGDVREKHESNNCSTEAVFEVTTNQVENVQTVDFVPQAFQFLQTPVYAGDPARFTGSITNQGTAPSPSGIRSSYTVSCNGGPEQYLTDDGTDQGELNPGMTKREETNAAVIMPNVVGTCTAYFRVDYQGAVTEDDETNNVASFTFTLAPRPAPNLYATTFRDDRGCCTTNTGNYIDPRIWIYNAGPAAPATTVQIIYQIASPVATGGNYILMRYGSLRPDELMPGATGHDGMDNQRWQIPRTSAWKKQWHNIRACIKPDGSTPVGGGVGELCYYYQRYSKE